LALSAALDVLFILKLSHTIDWSWWVVTLPLTVPVGIAVAALALVGAGQLYRTWKVNKSLERGW
jgi:hypothetical protein